MTPPQKVTQDLSAVTDGPHKRALSKGELTHEDSY